MRERCAKREKTCGEACGERRTVAANENVTEREESKREGIPNRERVSVRAYCSVCKMRKRERERRQRENALKMRECAQCGVQERERGVYREVCNKQTP